MDSADNKPEIPESLMTDEIIHNVAGTDLTISALFYSGNHGEGVTELKLESLMTNSVKNEEKMGDDFIDPSSGMTSALVVLAPQVDNYHTYEVFKTNRRLNSPDHGEKIIQDTSIPAVKQENMDVVIKGEETDDVSMEEIHNNEIIEEEIQDCKESIKLDINCSWMDNQKRAVNAERQPVVMKNELSEDRLQEDFVESERFYGDSVCLNDQMSTKSHESSIHLNTVMIPASHEQTDCDEPRSSDESGDEAETPTGLKSKHQLYKSRSAKMVEGLKDADEYATSEDGSQLGNKEKPHSGVQESGRKSFTCSECMATFSRKDALKVHQRKHTGDTFNCLECVRHFTSNYALQQHFHTYHQGHLYQCDICDKVYLTKGGLSYHNRSHKQVFRYLCDHCGKGFNYKTEYEAHINSHLHVSPHHCDKCEKHFRSSSSLAQHRAGCGVIEKLFTCDICPKKFKRQKYMKEHRLTHTEPLRYQCTHCGQCYAHRGSLIKHKKVHS